jgi:hypothetical protein
MHEELLACIAEVRRLRGALTDVAQACDAAFEVERVAYLAQVPGARLRPSPLQTRIAEILGP